jgi:glycosyltransferase involved in cell wall biosynthesis
MSAQPARGQRPTRVVLLRDLEADANVSMDRYADEVARGLAARPEIAAESASLPSFGVAARTVLGRAARTWQRFVAYRRHAARLDADVYHVLDHSYVDVAAALPAERTVVTCHDVALLKAEQADIGFRGRRRDVWRFRRRLRRLRHVAHVACVSESTLQDVIELVGVPSERTSVIAHGIDPQFRPLDRTAVERVRQGLVEGPATILHVSTGGPYKNVEGTLRVLARLRQQGLDAVLVRAGTPLSPSQRALRDELGLAEAVVECGHVSDDRLVQLYNASDVLLFPSYHEGFGWPPLEAMACGTPVVTSDCAALAELVGDAGLRAGADDVDGLASAVRAVLEGDEERERLRAAGLERARRYSWEHAAAALSELYRTVAARAEAGEGSV